ncbi:ankyrin repeat and KH domain-containing protein 1-like [Haliotis cracherodii]|uniref:ankyrin repeat and KH domain-containing protein 1-like n=1 Tax=Haliotis cracherodii TaxID=6455 RepID=UPI0039EA39DE
MFFTNISKHKYREKHTKIDPTLMASRNDDPEISVQYLNIAHLKYLIKAGDVVAVQKFIQTSQINPSQECVKDIPPVFTAARYGQVDVMHVLISMGFAWNDSRRFNIGRRVDVYSSIHCAAYYGHVDIVRALVMEYGVDAQVLNLEQFEIDECLSLYPFPRVPLWFAVHGGRLNVVEFLFEYVDSCHKAIEFPGDHSPLMLAAMGEHQDICRYLISRVGNTKERKSYLCNELLQTIRTNHIEAAHVLLDCEADVREDTDKQQDGFFAQALLMGSLEMMKLLHSYGYDADAVPANTFSRHSLDVVRYLAVDLNAKIVLSEYWFKSMPSDIITLLIKAGCQFTHRDYDCLEEMFDIRRLSHPTFMNFVRQTISIPRSLQDICCFRVRQLLGRNISCVGSLQLPQKVKDFIRLKHV